MESGREEHFMKRGTSNAKKLEVVVRMLFGWVEFGFYSRGSRVLVINEKRNGLV